MEGYRFLDWLSQVDAEGDGWIGEPAAVDVQNLAADGQNPAEDVQIPADVEQNPADEIQDPINVGGLDGEDEGIECDAYGAVHEKEKYISNMMSTPMDPRYCVSSAFVSIYSVYYGEEFRICEICYIAYSRRVPGEHQHRSNHKTISILDNSMEDCNCKCCGLPMYQITHIEVCNFCNP